MIVLRKHPVHTKKRTRSNKFVDMLQQTCYEHVDIRIRLHGLRRVVDD